MIQVVCEEIRSEVCCKNISGMVFRNVRKLRDSSRGWLRRQSMVWYMNWFRNHGPQYSLWVCNSCKDLSLRFAGLNRCMSGMQVSNSICSAMILEYSESGDHGGTFPGRPRCRTYRAVLPNASLSMMTYATMPWSCSSLLRTPGVGGPGEIARAGRVGL